MLFDIFLLRYFSIPDVAVKSIPFCTNRGLGNPCKSTSLDVENVNCINLLVYFEIAATLDFSLAPTERFHEFVMIADEQFDCVPQPPFGLIVN